MKLSWNRFFEVKWLRDILLGIIVYSMLIFKSWEHRENYAGGIPEYLFDNGITWMVILSIIYINHLLLIPRFFEKKLYLSYSIFLVFIILIESYFQDLHCGCGAVKAKFFFYLLTTGIGMAALFYRRYVGREAKLREKELLQRQMELNYLKSQVNPHFMFNSLNSLYVLSRQKSDNAPEVVMQLSQLMRYQLESSKQQIVSLQEELDFIQNYLLLEELRLGERCRVEFEIEGNTGGLLIAPMLLIPFVENAFKHGANKTREKSEVEVKAKVEGKQFSFFVFNSIPKNENGLYNNLKTDSLGLENVKRRLSLIYPQHQLEVIKKKNSYQIILNLNLVSASKKVIQEEVIENQFLKHR